MACHQGFFMFCLFWLISIDVSQSNPVVIIPASGLSEEPATFGQLKAKSLHLNDTGNSVPPVVVAVEPLPSQSATSEAPSSPVPVVAGASDMMQDSKVDERPVTSSNRTEDNSSAMILVPAETIIPAGNKTASNASDAENAAPAEPRTVVLSNTEATSEATTEATTEAITEASTERTPETTSEASSSIVVSNASSSIPATITDKADIVTTVNAPLVVVVTNASAPVAVSQASSNDSAAVPNSEEQAPKQARDLSNTLSNGPASDLATNTTALGHEDLHASGNIWTTAGNFSAASSAVEGIMLGKGDISLTGSAGHQDNSNGSISSTEASFADPRALDVPSVENNETVSNPSGHAAIDIHAPIAPPPLLAPEPVMDSVPDKAGHSDFSAGASHSTDNQTSDFAALNATKSKVDDPAPKQVRQFSAVNDSVLTAPKPNASNSHDSIALSSQASEPVATKISSEFNAANPPALNLSESAADSSGNASHESAASGPVESNKADPGMPAAHAGNESSSHVNVSDRSSATMADLSKLGQQLAENSAHIAERSSEMNSSKGHSGEHSSSGHGIASSNETASSTPIGGTEIDSSAKSGSSLSSSDHVSIVPVAAHSSSDAEPKQARQLSDHGNSSGDGIPSSNENWGKWEMGKDSTSFIGGTEIDKSAKSSSSLSSSDHMSNAMVAASSSSETEPKQARQFSDPGNPTTAASTSSAAPLLSSSFPPSSDGASSDLNSTPFSGTSGMTSSAGSAMMASDASGSPSEASLFGSTLASSSGPFTEGSVASSTDAGGASSDSSFSGSTFASSNGPSTEGSAASSTDPSGSSPDARFFGSTFASSSESFSEGSVASSTDAGGASSDSSFSGSTFASSSGPFTEGSIASSTGAIDGSSPDASFSGSTFASSSGGASGGSTLGSNGESSTDIAPKQARQFSDPAAPTTAASAASASSEAPLLSSSFSPSSDGASSDQNSTPFPGTSGMTSSAGSAMMASDASVSSSDASFFGSTFASSSGVSNEGSVTTSSDVSSLSPEGDIIGSTFISSSEATSEGSVFVFSSTHSGSGETSLFPTEQANGDMSTLATGEPISSESSDNASGLSAAHSVSFNSSAAAEGNLSPPVHTNAEQLVNLFGPEAISLNLSEPLKRQVREFLDKKASSEATKQAVNTSSAISSSNDELTTEAAVSEQTMETSTEAIKSSSTSGSALSPSEGPVNAFDAAALSSLSKSEQTDSKADKQVRQFQGQNQNAAAAVNNAVQGVAALNAQLFGVQFTPHFRQLAAKSAQAPEPFTALDDLRGKVRLEADTAYEIMTTARAGVDYPNLADIPFTSFSCERVNQPGFYADTDPASRCQVIRRCDANAIAWAYLCPNATVFNQITLTCDWFFNVDCGRAERYYDYSNSRLYQEGVVLLDTALTLPTAVNTNSQFNPGQGQQNQNTFNQGQQGNQFNQNQNQFNQGQQANQFGQNQQQNQNQFAQNQQSNQNRWNNGKK